MSAPIMATKFDQGHKRGSIVRIKMKNFLTYTEGEMYPGPKLNIIMGPNGSGKSTVVCAIALGLGATAKLLERGDNISDYIMRDKDSGSIEIELKDDRRNHVIKREFEKTHNKSVWKLNGQVVTQTKIKELVEDHLGIQVDNLCTFLPQEKVGHFTTLNPQQLLVETEKALCKNRLYEKHEELISLQTKMKDRTQERDALQKSLTELEEQNKALERDKKRMEERQQHLDQAELLKKAKMWIELDRKKALYVQLKNQKKELDKRRQEAEKSLEPYVRKVDELKQQMEDTKLAVNKVKKAEEKVNAAAEKASERCTDCDDAVMKANEDLQKLESQRANQERILARKRSELVIKKKELANLDLDDIKEKISELKADYRTKMAAKDEAMERLDNKQNECESIRRMLESKRRELQNLQNQAAVQRKNFERIWGSEQALEAQKWIATEKHLFRGRIYGPLGLEIRVTDAKHAAAIVEDAIGQSTLTAFAVENKADETLLYNKRREKDWNFSIISIGGRSNEHERRKFGPQDMDMLKREADITCYADTLMECSEPVKQALYIATSLFESMVGTERTEEKMNQQADYFGVLLRGGAGGDEDGGRGQSNAIAYTEAKVNGKTIVMKYGTIRGRYDGTINTTAKDVRPPRLFCATQDPERLHAVEQRVKELEGLYAEAGTAVQALQRESGKLEAECTAVNKQIQDLKKKGQSGPALSGAISRLEDTIREMERNLSRDQKKERDNLEKTLRASVYKMVEQAGRYVDLAAERALVPLKGLIPRLENQNSKAALNDAIQIHRRKSEEYEDLVQECQDLESRYQAAQAEAKALLKKCREIAPIEPNFPNRDEVLTNLMAEITGKTEDEVQEMIEEEETAAANITHNPQVIRLYEQRKREIESKTKELETLLNTVNNGQEKIEKIKVDWLQKLQNLTDKVNARFSHYMRQMEVEGAVKLATAEDNFRQYGLEISVAFRKNQKMSILSANVQSGGERSVSTILYLMALQDQMASPFRCVDEINQGMDERNERLIFSRIVANTASPDEPQYFLITPKLLSALTAMDHDHVMVHIVFNGPGCYKYRHWDMDKLLERQPPSEEQTRGGGGAAASSSSRSTNRGKRGRSSQVVEIEEEEEEREDEEEDEMEFSQAKQGKRQRNRE